MLISGKMVERLKLTKEPVCACKRASWNMELENERINLSEETGERRGLAGLSGGGYKCVENKDDAQGARPDAKWEKNVERGTSTRVD